MVVVAVVVVVVVVVVLTCRTLHPSQLSSLST